MKGRAGGWRERGTFYYLTGARFRGYSLYHDPFQDGRLAQRLERSPHTREVKGSNPLSPTTPLDSATVLDARNPATSCICAELAIYPHGQVVALRLIHDGIPIHFDFERRSRARASPGSMPSPASSW